MTDNNIITKCPYCRRRNDVATSMNTDARPGDGHISICWGCGKPAVFDLSRPYNVRKPTFAEHLVISADPQIQKAMRVYQIARTPDEANRMMSES